MPGESHITVRGDADRGRIESSECDSGLVKCGDAGDDGRAKDRGGGRSERSASENRAEGRALVRFDRNPDAVVVSAPREHRRKRRMAMVVEALQTRNGSRGFGLRHLYFVHDHRLPVA
jgi:hypothetical protein